MTTGSAAVNGTLLGLFWNLETGPHRKPKSSVQTPLAPLARPRILRKVLCPTIVQPAYARDLSGRNILLHRALKKIPFRILGRYALRRNDELNNHANQLNPNNDAYWEARGYGGRPDDWEDRIDRYDYQAEPGMSSKATYSKK